MIQIVATREVVETRVHSHEEWPLVAPHWGELFHSSRRFSFFLSEEWVDTWMSVFGSSLRPSILLFHCDGEVLGACLLVESRVRQALLPVRRIHLNAFGEHTSEATYPEFNDLLCRSGFETAVARTLVRYLQTRKWDEFRLEGFRRGPGYDALRSELPGLRWHEDRQRSFYVDLAAIRNSRSVYESVLGKTTRKRLRQNRRHFYGESPLAVQVPGSAEEALSMFEEVAALNRRRRKSLGKQSVFDAGRFVEFHRRLIRRCFGERTVQLVRVAAGDSTLGTLYLFQQHGKVYFYQCGFEFSSDPKWSPGTVTVAEAIQYCLDAGFDEYDFLAHDDAYKERLSTGSHPLVWADASRPGLKMEYIRRLRRIKRLHWNTRTDSESTANGVEDRQEPGSPRQDQADERQVREGASD